MVLNMILEKLKKRIKSLPSFAIKESRDTICAAREHSRSSVEFGGEKFLRLIGAQAALSAFAEYIVELPELSDFSLSYRAAMSAYEAHGRAVGPVSPSFFFYAMCLDFQFGDKETISSLFQSVADIIKLPSELKQEMVELSASGCSVFVHEGFSGELLQVRDLITAQAFELEVHSGYRGQKGDIIFTRVSYPVSEGEHGVILTTPYIINGSTKSDWESFFVKHQITGDSEKESLHAFFRNGPVALKAPKFYWLSYVTAAYEGQKSGAIYLKGAPGAYEGSFNVEKKLDVAKKLPSISGTFLHYMDPLLSGMGVASLDSPEVSSALKVGWSVWNAVVSADVNGDPSFLKMVEKSVVPPYNSVVNVLIERKRALFGEHKFFIGEYGVRRKPDGTFSLFAEAKESKGLRVH